jgi:type IV fimbrial biogenesis protein FimT
LQPVYAASIAGRRMMHNLVTHMVLAKREAIKRNARVAICRSLDGLYCSTSGDWEHGWIVFHDANDSGLREPDEVIVKSLVIDNPTVKISGNGNIDRYVSYSAMGSTKLVSGAFQAGTFTLPYATQTDLEARQVIINSIGRVRVTKVSAAVYCRP